MFLACGENPSAGKSLPALAMPSLNNCQLSFLAERLGLYSSFPQRSGLTNTENQVLCVCVWGGGSPSQVSDYFTSIISSSERFHST